MSDEVLWGEGNANETRWQEQARWPEAGVAVATTVDSVFGRLGDIVAVSGDYESAQIGIAPPISVPRPWANVRLYLTNLSLEVDTAAVAANNAMPKSGGVFTGPITLSADGSSALHPASKQQLDLKEATANKGVANGYASLDGSAKVPAVQLPSYVDDVLEFTNLAAFPATGTAGIMYVALDTGKIYRWSGSAYVEISPSPGSTDSVPEGSTNLYFTNERVDDRTAALIQNGTGITWSYNDAAGTLTPTVTGSVTPAALTKTDDTNVTLTLGGTPATALLQAASITAGWTGTLSAVRGGFGANVSASNGVPLFATGVATFTGTTGTGNFVRAADAALTGNPTAPTQTAGDNDTSIATTAFVTGAVSTATVAPATVPPIMDGVSAVGVATKYAREDHKHPSDTSRELTVAAGTTAQYYRGDKAWTTLDKTAVGLGNVDNTSDVNKPISSAEQAALNLKLSLAGGTMTGDIVLWADANAAMEPVTKQQLDAVSTAAAAGVGQPLDVGVWYPGAPLASAVLLQFVAVRAFTLPINLTGSRGYAGTVATAGTTITIAKNGANVGTVVFAGAATTSTFTMAAGQSFVAGDRLTLTAPATPDATLADFSIVLMGSRA